MLGILKEIKHYLKQLDPGRTRRHWSEALGEEVNFWREYLTTRGLEWPDEYQIRVEPDSLLDERLICDRIALIPGPTVSILDVGAGPLTILGKRYPGKELYITAIDPLGSIYDRLLEDTQIPPPVRTLHCEGEKILKRFKPNTFDFAYSRNAIDHSYDPLKVIENMLAVVKPYRFVLLRHLPNEAERARYKGLHQWNFDRRENDLLVRSRFQEINVTKRLAGKAEMTCTIDGEWLTAVITKHTNPS
jgi:SAM-dependent methyltransferase